MTTRPRGMGMRIVAYLTACVLVAACGSPADEVPLSVMSFNIRYGTADDGENHWNNRIDLVVETIRTAAPDLLALQEALRFQLDTLRGALAEYGEIGVGRDDGAEAGEYAAILYRKERLRPVTQGTFWLSDTPDVPGSMSWGNRIPRICTWARFEDLTSGEQFVAYNVHFDHESQPSRLASAALLREWISRAEETLPAIVLGDFNAGEDNPARQLLLTALPDDPAGVFPLTDSYRDRHAPSAGEGTFNAFFGDTTGARIDAILVSPAWIVRSAAIMRNARDGRYPSDHFPVTALLQRRSPDR